MKRRKHLSVEQGTLPIFRDVVVHGMTYRKRLDSGDRIVCRICGTEFDLNEEASFIERGTDIPYIKCPNCDRLVMAAKYMKE